MIDPGPGEPRMEVYCDFVMVPWRDEAGTVMGVIGAASDVTDQAHRRLAAEQRATSAQQDLHKARETLTVLQDALLRLVAPAGTPAQHILELVALPYSTTPPG